MAGFRCKMCGGVIFHDAGDSVGTCSDCRSVQTLPKTDNEARLALYEKAHYERRNHQNRRALKSYDRLIKTEGTDSEAYWGRILVRYRIWYKQNTADFSRDLRIGQGIFRDLQKDPDYVKVLKYADERQKPVYEKEASLILQQQKKKRRVIRIILSVVMAMATAALILVLAIPPVNRSKAFRQYGTMLEGLAVGDVFFYGAWEQDTDTANGAEPIEWVVLDKQEDRMLVLSLFGLETRQFHHIDIPTQWNACTARRWLNGPFLKSAFGNVERSLILKSDVYIDKSLDQLEGTYCRDHIFVLNRFEVQDCLSMEQRLCRPTQKAASDGAYVSPENGNCRWWLRSPGQYVYNSMVVLDDGTISQIGRKIDSSPIVLRPAMWIRLQTP